MIAVKARAGLGLLWMGLIIFLKLLPELPLKIIGMIKTKRRLIAAITKSKITTGEDKACCHSAGRFILILF